ncbi:MAG: methionine biosynthesis protein MetW [Gammaproteobacteria bacterium]|nr:methionine biosynthesis protein MetW [Gammaproteobacteria bacterium]
MRVDLELISKWIEPGSRVLDLACGDGTLLAWLHDHKQVTGYGIEIDPDYIAECICKGVNVIQTDLDAGLSDFDANSFDYVLITQSLQAMHFPDRLLDEMLRVGRQGIVSFPNMGHWMCRTQFTLRGRMPVTRALGNNWYDTPNIHLCTIADFEALCAEKQITILQRAAVDYTHKSSFIIDCLPNLLAELALYRFEKKRR